MKNVIIRVFLLCALTSFIGCATRAPIQTGQKEIVFELNKMNVSTAVVEKCTKGFGIKVALSDNGWKILQYIRSQNPRAIVMFVKGKALTTEIPVAYRFPKEFFYVPSVGEYEYTKEEAEIIVKGILE